MYRPITVAVSGDATVADITVPIKGKGTDAASNASLAALRGVIVPQTLGRVPDAEVGERAAGARPVGRQLAHDREPHGIAEGEQDRGELCFDH